MRSSGRWSPRSSGSKLPNLFIFLCGIVVLSMIIWSNGWVSMSGSAFRFLSAENYFTYRNKGYVVGDVADLVNVFIGTAGEGAAAGHVFPGATLPHGMAKPGMDTDSPGNHAGYDARSIYNVVGFSQLHEDGTGGGTPLSNFKLFPLASCPPTGDPAISNLTLCTTNIYTRKIRRALKPKLKQNTTEDQDEPMDEGSPGYFATTLQNGIKVELTATRRTSLHRYTFPYPMGNSSVLLVDMTNDGQVSGRNAKLDIDPTRGRMTGGASFIGSFGPGSYKAFLCVDFFSEPQTQTQTPSPSNPTTPSEYAVYSYGAITPQATTFPSTAYGDAGALFAFAPSSPTAEKTVVLARVGLSLISSAQACSNAESEIPVVDFEKVRADARAQWNELLGSIDLHVFERGSAVGKEEAGLFYSSLYRSHIVPADYTGENYLWNSTKPDMPYYDSLYCNWDTYRTLFPLLSLQDPHVYARVVRSFIDIQQHEGFLPECRSTGLRQYIQGGSNGDPIVAEFYVKFKDYMEKLSVDPNELWESLVKDAEVESEEWDYGGRQAKVWKELGYLPFGSDREGGTATRQVSRTLEYAYDDFTISQVASYMGKEADAQKYRNRSLGFTNLWDPNTFLMDVSEPRVVPMDDAKYVEGIKGFMQLRRRNGTFVYTDPRRCTPHDPQQHTCYYTAFNIDGFYEGGSIVYSQYVPHDTAKLIELQGGVDAFIRRLDYIFDNDYFDSTNEPSQQMPFMYHYANRPGLSTERSRQAITRDYNTTIFGLPGNDDSGAMGSFVAFLMLGLYPLPATRQFLISSPYFPKVSIRNSLFNTTLTIVANGFTGNTPQDSIYVKSIRVNGRRWKSNCYLDWETFEKGGVVDLELSRDRNVTCGDHPDALPYSVSTGGYNL